MDDFLFRGDLADLDPDVAALVDLEALRQARRLILIPSESTVPAAVRQALGSVFHNIYAEGYPSPDWHAFDSRRFWMRICGWPRPALFRRPLLQGHRVRRPDREPGAAARAELFANGSLRRKTLGSTSSHSAARPPTTRCSAR